jgi:hypothetical protein
MIGLMLQRESSSQVQDKMIYPFSCFVSAFLANTTSTSANVLLPIQRFWPSMCHPPGTCSTRHQALRCMLSKLSRNTRKRIHNIQFQICSSIEIWENETRVKYGTATGIQSLHIVICTQNTETSYTICIALQYVPTRFVGFSFNMRSLWFYF